MAINQIKLTVLFINHPNQRWASTDFLEYEYRPLEYEYEYQPFEYEYEYQLFEYKYEYSRNRSRERNFRNVFNVVTA